MPPGKRANQVGDARAAPREDPAGWQPAGSPSKCANFVGGVHAARTLQVGNYSNTRIKLVTRLATCRNSDMLGWQQTYEECHNIQRLLTRDNLAATRRILSIDAAKQANIVGDAHAIPCKASRGPCRLATCRISSLGVAKQTREYRTLQEAWRSCRISSLEVARQVCE